MPLAALVTTATRCLSLIGLTPLGPVILSTAEEFDLWLGGETVEALKSRYSFKLRTGG
jgi:hypothetical protein